ncbi:MAG TPA: hypothetical protein VJ727_05100 [Rhodanobacteraceae bacterium]|nr:hypothetical protein [Rhodanobacteraceae bacterium]
MSVRRNSHRRAAVVARSSLLCVSLLLAACGHHASAPTQGTTEDAQAQQQARASWEGFVPGVPIRIGHALKAADLSPTELKYGVAPKQAPGLIYQDNVVLLENGDTLIRAADGNGMTWTLDAGDARVAALKPGDIVFATSRCVGRVLSAQRDGGNVKLILGPVQLTDLIKQGNFHYDQPVDLRAMVTYSSPDYPGAPNSTAQQQMTTTQDGSGVARYAVANDAHADFSDAVWHPGAIDGMFLQTAAQMPGVPGMNIPQVPAGLGEAANDPPPPTVDMINGMQMYACSFDCGGLGLKLYQEKNGVKVWLNAIFHLVNPHLVFDLGISPKTGINAHVVLSGGAGFTTTFDAIAAQDMRANIKETGAVPAAITIPLGGMGVPLTAMFQQSLYLATGFSARTSLLHSKGDFTASGAVEMNFVNGAWNIPPLKMELRNNIADAVGGVSVGINSLVFAVDQRLMVGVGGLGFATGPYVNLISNITALKQASQAVDCRQGTFGMQLGGGIGYAMPKIVAKAINFFLGLVHITPVPEYGYIVKLKNNIPLVDLRQEIPDHCAG